MKKFLLLLSFSILASIFWVSCGPDDPEIPIIKAFPENRTVFDESVVVSFSVNPSADIYYTIDGSLPTQSSPKYTTPIFLTETTIINTLAITPDGGRNIQSFKYIKNDNSNSDVTNPTPDPVDPTPDPVEPTPDPVEPFSLIDHTDVIIGFVYSKELLDFVTPHLLFLPSGKKEFEIDIDDGVMLSNEQFFKYKSISANILSAKNNEMWWFGTQFEGLNQSGEFELTFTKKNTDYSLYNPELNLTLTTFARAGNVKKGENPYNAYNLFDINISIGNALSKTLEQKIDELVSKKYTKKF